MESSIEQQAAYLEAHGLDKVLEALVVETMDQQPEDPYAFMSEQMFRLADAFAALTSEPARADAAAAKEDGWWTKWKGPDVTLSIEEKVKLSAGVAEEIIKDLDELRQALNQMGLGDDRKAAAVLLRRYDSDGGGLSIQEFTQLVADMQMSLRFATARETSPNEVAASRRFVTFRYASCSFAGQKYSHCKYSLVRRV